jgi:hypothetical protein
MDASGGRGQQIGNDNAQRNENITQHALNGVTIGGSQNQITLNLAPGGFPLLPAQRPEQIVQISSLLPPGTGSILHGRLFDDSVIIGPAVLAPQGGVAFEFCTWDTDDGGIESIFWEFEPRAIFGAIGLINCTFRRCRFNSIGLAGTQKSLEDFRAIGFDH